MSRPVITAGTAIALSGLAGAAVAVFEPLGPALLFGAVLAVAAVAAAIHFGSSPESHNPLATFLVALSIFAVAWQGVQGPASVPVADFPFLLAIPLIALALLQRQMPWVFPGWFLVVAGGLALGGLLALLLVPDPPPFLLGHANTAELGTAAPRQTSFSFFLRTVYALVAVPVLIAAVADSWGRVRFFADIWLASTAACALVACLDYFAHAGIADALVTVPFDHVRAVGLTDQPNYLGQFTSMALPLGIVRIHQTTGPARVLALSATGLLLLGLQLSGSRLGLLGAVIAVAFLAAGVPRIRVGILVGVVAFVTLGAASLVYQPGGRSALERLSGGDPTSSQSESARRQVLDRSLAIVGDHPITGVGFSRILDSHSIPLQLLLAGGIAALTAFCLWVWNICRLGVMVARSKRAPPANAELAVALNAAMAAWLIPGLLNPQLLERFMYIPAGLLLGMGYLLTRSSSAEPAEPRPQSQWAERAGSAQPAAPRRALAGGLAEARTG